MATESLTDLAVEPDVELVGAHRRVSSALPSSARGLKRLGWYLLLSALAFCVVFPIYLTIVRALSTPGDYVFAGSPPYPVAVDWGVFGQAFKSGGLGQAFLISTVVCVLTVVAQVVTATLAAYAFAFLRFPFKNLLFSLAMASMLLPMEVTLIANLTTVRELHWINTYQGLVLPFAASAFGMFLIRQAFTGIPVEIRDATCLDGYGHLRFLVRFAVPLTRPVIASFVLIAALTSWGNYLWPRVIITDDQHQTLPIALSILTSAGPDKGNVATAGALLALLPIAILLVAFQRQLVRGLTAGAVKG